MMELISTELPDVVLIKPKVFFDQRGFFLESYHEKKFKSLIGLADFVQDNHSRSTKHVLRGLHYQMDAPQGKLVRVTRGTVYDVAVDLRKSSPYFGKWVGMTLSEENFHMAWIPPGFAHGFLTLSEEADVLYKVTTLYNPALDRSLLWNDPEINIQWPLEGAPKLSDKDARAKLLSEAEHYA